MTKEPTGEVVSAPEPSPDSPTPRWQRTIWILAVLLLFAAGIAAVAFRNDQFYRLSRFSPWLLPVCWTASFALLVGFAPRLAPTRKPVWLTAAALLGLPTLLLWPAVLIMSGFDDGPTQVTSVQPSPDGRVHAVTETYWNSIDPSCRVWLREPGGLFAREVLVWHRVDSNCPEVSFPTPTTISITYYPDRPPFTTTFDPDNMRVTETFAWP
ncbi:hypothetical protein ACWIGI_23965 [Nocardia sp. NPDC055321]